MNKGFTLIEVLIAIFLITVGAGGAFILIQRTIAFTDIISSQLTATYLAQEGIERVRNARDSNWLAGNDWDLNLPSGTEEIILGKEKFKQTITIDTVEGVPPDTALLISVEVSWQEWGRTHQVTAQTKLYNWR